VNYPSRIGDLIGAGIADYPRAGDRQNAECMQILAGMIGVNCSGRSTAISLAGLP